MSLTGEEGLFASLFKWGDRNAKAEDFWSKSLIYITHRLRHHPEMVSGSPDLATDFWNRLLSVDLDPSSPWSLHDHVQLKPRNNRGKNKKTRKQTRSKPDIVIRQPGRLCCYVEVKTTLEPTVKQMTKYESQLRNEKNTEKRELFVLSCSGRSAQGTRPHVGVSWIDVAAALLVTQQCLVKNGPQASAAPEAYWLVKDFRSFLAQEGMALNKLDHIPGPKDTTALCHLLHILQAAVRETPELIATPKLYIEQFEEAGREWIGFLDKVNQQQRYTRSLGLYCSTPHEIIVGFHEAKMVDKLSKNAQLQTTTEKDWKPVPKHLDLFYQANVDSASGKWAEVMWRLPHGFIDTALGEQKTLVRNRLKEVASLTKTPSKKARSARK